MKGKFMNKKFTYLFSALIMTIVVVWGFSTSGLFDRDPNATREAGQYMVQGPELESPLGVLSESFEGVTFPPAGWTKLSPDGGPGWNRQTNGTTPIPGWNGGTITVPPGGGNAVAFATWTTGGAVGNDQWLITPQISGVQLDDSLKFWLRYWPDSYRDSIEVKISTTTPTVAAFTTLVWRKNFSVGSGDTNWVQYKFRLGDFVTAGANIYIGFRETVLNNLSDGSSFSLDLVEVTSAPTPVVCNYTYANQTSGTALTLYSVSAVNDMVAWAAGVGSTVRRTTDGGMTWGNGNPTPGTIVGDIYNIYAVDANTAFVTTSPSATFIYKTTNAGANWTQVYTLAGGFINAIEMTSALTGYAEGDPVGGTWTILTTVDGGNTWVRMPTEPTQAGAEAGWNNSFQAMGTNIWFGTNNTRVYRSSDLGLTWSFAATTGTVNTYGVHFNNSLNGVAGGNAGVYTTDGGVTWLTSPVPGTGNITGGIAGGNDNFWVCRGTSLYRSSDNGATWITTAVHTAAGTLWDMDMKVNDCPTGWAVGASGVIAKVTGTIVGITNVGSEVPSSYLLKQNFPNPFNPTTNIHFAIPQSGLVTLKVFDIAGREISTLVNEVRAAGSYIVDFNASELSSGAYFYRIESGNFVDTKKMMLIK